jgi:hypothetical protein
LEYLPRRQRLQDTQEAEARSEIFSIQREHRQMRRAGKQPSATPTMSALLSQHPVSNPASSNPVIFNDPFDDTGNQHLHSQQYRAHSPTSLSHLLSSASTATQVQLTQTANKVEPDPLMTDQLDQQCLTAQDQACRVVD